MSEQKYTPEEYLKDLEAKLSEHEGTLEKLRERAEADEIRRKELETGIPDTADELEWLKRKLPSMREELAGIGRFARKKKKELAALIDSAETTIKEMTAELASMRDEMSSIILEKNREKMLAEQSVVSDMEADIEQMKQYISQTSKKKALKKKDAKRSLGVEGYELFVFDPDDDDDESED